LGVFDEDTTVEVPNVVGETSDAARLLLIDAGLDFDMTSRQPSPTVEEGKVISQDPPAGSQADRGSMVRLVISTGPPPAPITEVPDVEGLSEDEAIRRLEDAGFNWRVSEDESEDVDEGEVISQRPPGGTRVPLDTLIQITVSSGPPATTEPPSTTPPSTTPPSTDPPVTEPSTESTESTASSGSTEPTTGSTTSSSLPG
jgi:serine/threonine-protein kinase